MSSEFGIRRRSELITWSIPKRLKGCVFSSNVHPVHVKICERLYDGQTETTRKISNNDKKEGVTSHPSAASYGRGRVRKLGYGGYYLTLPL